MSDGTWRPFVVAGMVVAIAIGMGAVSRDEVRAQSLDETRRVARAWTPNLNAKPARDLVPAPVAVVDEVGTVRLTGRDGRTVALTFDDGPHPRYTPKVVAILREYEIQATFCVVGRQVEAHPSIVEEIAADGHALCNHTMSHDLQLRQRAENDIETDLGGTSQAIYAAVPAADVAYFRAPGGGFAANVNSVAQSFGMTPLGWSIDTEDWRKPGADVIHETVIDAIHPGAVVLLHDGGGDRSATVEALPAIIETLASQGYEFVVPRS